MRWSIIRLIWFRELRDQLRDRRTVIMVTVLPLLLYPAVGLGLLQIAASFARTKATVGVIGADRLPQAHPRSAGVSPLPAVLLFAEPPFPGNLVLAAAAQLGGQGLGQSVPPLLVERDEQLTFFSAHFDSPDDAESFTLQLLAESAPAPAENDAAWLESLDRSALKNRKVDVLLAVPPGFRERLENGGRPTIYLLTRDGDDRSRLIGQRVQNVLAQWRRFIKQARLLAVGQRADLDEAFDVRDDRPENGRRIVEQIAASLVRVFPFLLVLWSLTGALYPAVDVCAGEKERGTMETLLISPVSREEIVYGKFLTIWVFSAGTALLNLLSMGVTTLPLAGALPGSMLRPEAMVWCVVVCLPLAAFFSALCLAVGAYARSSKEGQYYLMPLFLFTMPLIFVTLAPGVELNAFTSMIPVTGVALLLGRLLTAPSLSEVPWGYFIPVLGTMTLYGWLALRWAVSQFNREEVLFREAERLDLGLWLRSLWRAKEPLPSLGQALFCFALILALRWLSFGLGARLPLGVRTAISTLAFVVTPPLLLAILLTTRPLESLKCRLAKPRYLLLSLILAVLLAPVGGVILGLTERWPELMTQLRGYHPLPDALVAVRLGEPWPGRWSWALALLPLVCEEIAFRGFLLTGLRRRLGPWTAVATSALLFAIYPMNVFQFLPLFFLGLLLGILATRAGSIVPGILFHLCYVLLLVGLAWLERNEEPWAQALTNPIVVTATTSVAVVLILRTAYRHTASLWVEG